MHHMCTTCATITWQILIFQVLDRGSKKSDALRKKLLADAENHRNRLLDYDKAHEKRTKVTTLCNCNVKSLAGRQ